VFGFEKLDVWQKSVEMADAVYRLTQEFPDSERFGLANQMRRTAVSVCANIAEGSGRGSNRDFSRFIEVAYGSLMELVSHLHIVRRQEFVAAEVAGSLYRRADQVARMLSGLRSHLRKDK